MNNIWKGTLLTMTILLLDQFSKGVVQKTFLLGEEKIFFPKFISIIYVQSSATAWGVFDHWDMKTKNMFLLSFSLLILLWAIRRLIILRREYIKILPYIFVISGLFGNMMDRLLYGHVVSFIKVAPWVFNFSDISIALAIILSIFNICYFSGKASVSRTL